MRVLNILLENDFAEKVYLSLHINFLLQHLFTRYIATYNE